MTAESRCCVYCGRRGSRQFLPLGQGGYICKRAAACGRRRRAALGPLLRRRAAA